MIDVWRWTMLLGLMLCCASIVWTMRRRTGVTGALLWLYSLCSALFIFQRPDAPYPKWALLLDQTSGQAFAEILAIPLAVLFLPKKVFSHWKNAFVIFGLIECVAVFVFGYGLMVGSTFDSAMIAALFPLAAWFVWIPFLITVIYVKGATAVLILLSQLGTLFMVGGAKRKWLAVGVVALLGVAIVTQRSELISSTGRVTEWLRFGQWWIQNANPFTGTGMGTFQWLGPIIQNKSEGVMIQMHNDWMQMLFEGGLIGFALLVAFFSELCLAARGRAWLLASLIGVAAFGLTYHPFRFFPSALLLACLVRETLEGAKV